MHTQAALLTACAQAGFDPDGTPAYKEDEPTDDDSKDRL